MSVLCEKCHEYPKHRDTRFCRRCLSDVRAAMTDEERMEAYNDRQNSIAMHNRRAGRDA